MLKFWFQSKFRLANFNRSTVVWFTFWMFSRTSRLNQKPLFLEFSGFYILFSFQGSLLSLQQQLVYLITTRCVCQQLFYFLFFKEMLSYFVDSLNIISQLLYCVNHFFQVVLIFSATSFWGCSAFFSRWNYNISCHSIIVKEILSVFQTIFSNHQICPFFFILSIFCGPLISLTYQFSHRFLFYCFNCSNNIYSMCYSVVWTPLTTCIGFPFW